MKKERFFPEGVILTHLFCSYWLKLTPKQRKRARKKITLLTKNCRHPGLKTHPVHRCPGTWDCSLSKTERLVYSRRGPTFILHMIGGHSVIDKAHLHSFDDPGDPDLECE